MEAFKYCKACLATDVEMFVLDTTSEDSIGTIYSQLSQIPIFSMNQHVCFECARLLQKYNKFKAKCHRAHNVLYSVVHQDTVQLNKQVIQSIDRKLNKLESNLIISPAVVCYNKPVDEGGRTDAMVKVIEPQPPELETVEIKYENEPSTLDVEYKVECEQSGLNNTAKCEKHDELESLNCNNTPDFGGYRSDVENYTFVVSSDEDVPLTILKRKSKLIKIKEPKTKKRKISKIKTEDSNKNAISKSIANRLNFDDESLTECLDNLLDKDLDYTSDDSLIREITKARRKTKKSKIKKPTGKSENVEDELQSTTNGRRKLKCHNRNGKTIDLGFFEKHADVKFMTPDEARQEVLLRKESKNYKVSSFRCALCYRGFGVKAAFDNHMKKHTVECGEYECEICHVRYTARLRLAKHKSSSHKTKISCKICSYVCFCPRQARLHIKLHKGKKYPCPDCNQVFSMPHSLVQHRRKHLKTGTEIICEHCGSIFSTPKGLFVHCNQVHREEKIEKNGPNCDECNIHFTSEAAWKRHLVLSSKHTVSNGCKDCGEMFSTVEELRVHTKVHARVEIKKGESIKFPAPCSICDRWVSTRKDYRAHVTGSHPESELARSIAAELGAPKPYVCEVCGHGFPKKTFLTYHQLKHSDERPYKCDVCNKAYWHPSALGSHKRMHRQREVYPCDTCGSVLQSSSALLKHRKNHINLRPHKCVICEKGFINPSDLATHVKHVHDRVPYPKRRNKRVVKVAEFAQLH